MSYGLIGQDIEIILQAISKFSVISQAILFGSRAKGNYKTGSDIDLAIKGTEINHETVASLSFMLNEELALPYFFDIIHYEKITEPKLTQHIDRVGKVIYEKGL